MIIADSGEFDFSLQQQAVPISVDFSEDDEELSLDFGEIQQSGSGADGGYYLPSVAQSGEGEMTVDFVPSKADMPDVQPVTVALPRGEPGPAYELTEKDKSEIVDAVLEEMPSVPGGGPTVQADWSQNDESQPDFVKNRTHWAEQRPSIVWDGNPEGKDSFDASAIGLGVFLKIYDEALPADELKLAKVEKDNEEASYSHTLIEDATIGAILVIGAYSLFFMTANMAIDLTAVYGFAIPSAGLYVFAPADSYFAEGGEILFPEIVHALPAKYLPETVMILGGGNAVPILPSVIPMPSNELPYVDRNYMGELGSDGKAEYIKKIKTWRKGALEIRNGSEVFRISMELCAGDTFACGSAVITNADWGMLHHGIVTKTQKLLTVVIGFDQEAIVVFCGDIPSITGGAT